jgi:hypothetical protein
MEVGTFRDIFHQMEWNLLSGDMERKSSLLSDRAVTDDLIFWFYSLKDGGLA